MYPPLLLLAMVKAMGGQDLEAREAVGAGRAGKALAETLSANLHLCPQMEFTVGMERKTGGAEHRTCLVDTNIRKDSGRGAKKKTTVMVDLGRGPQILMLPRLSQSILIALLGLVMEVPRVRNQVAGREIPTD